jgi:hypothetical protein
MIKLPPGEPPFRVSYITLEGYAVDFLMRGQIDKQWEERLGGQPFIVPNGVFNTLKNIIKNYTQVLEAFEGDTFVISNKSVTKTDDSLAKKNNNKAFFEGSQGHIFWRTASKEDIQSLLDPTRQWNLEIDPAVTNVTNSLTFWRFANGDDVKSFQSKPGLGFLNYATSSYLPPDFYLLTLRIEGPGCGDDSGEDMTGLTLTARVLKFRVAVLENTSSKSIQLGKFSFKENASERLRSGDEDQSALKAAESTKQELFPLQVLNPREKLLIPLEMFLVYEDLQVLGKPASSNERNRTARELTKLGEIRFLYGETGGSYLDVPASELISVLNRPKSSPLLDKNYIFGPSINIESVEVDNVEYPFRQFDAGRLVINLDSSWGSCPFVYTYSSESGTWLSEGHILYGINSKLKESEDSIRLNRFDGRVLIKENEPEISFIDSVYVRAIALDGTEKLIYPRTKALHFADGNYLKLSQWEQLKIEFDLPRDLVNQEYFVVAKGYYVPLKK